MRNAISVEEIDELLNELERLSEAASRKKFFDLVLVRLKYLVQGRGAAILILAHSEQWLPIVQTGTVHALYIDKFGTQLSGQSYWASADRRFLAVPIRRLAGQAAQWQRGAIAVEFEAVPDPGEIEELAKLCDAFAEVLALRQFSELEDLLDHKWLSFQKSLSELANTSSVGEAAVSIVNDLATLLNADRVALTRRSSTGMQTLAVSGVVRLEHKSEAAVAIREISRTAMEQLRPISQHMPRKSPVNENDRPQSASASIPAPAADERRGCLLDNYICLPLAAPSRRGRPVATAAVLIEWSDYESFLLGTGTLNYVFPAFAASWLQHQRWLAVPHAVRRLFGATQPGHWSRWTGRLVRMAGVIVCMAAAAWALNLPTPLRIEAEGSLQPVTQRVVFAPLDGVIEQILVSDGQQVKAGDQLAKMRSPMLEIQLQEVQGEMRANAEKRDGLNVAINQLANENPSAYALQSKFSSEIRELETQLQTLEQKREALRSEQQKLSLTAPIDGLVIARQIERFLNSRPVRRGDALLRVVQLDGPWQLELTVADQDVGYLKRKLYSESQSTSGPIAATAPRDLEFVLASQPSEKLTAQATWMSETARNPQGTAVVVDLLAEVDEVVAARGHMGATVYAYVDCGQQPFWFVWSRPLIEAIQRKLWF
jgi:multidrug efflux pump subunit AcrA (membrane-fusion protein)